MSLCPLRRLREGLIETIMEERGIYRQKRRKRDRETCKKEKGIERDTVGGEKYCRTFTSIEEVKYMTEENGIERETNGGERLSRRIL